MFSNFDLNVHWYSQYVVYKHVKLWLLLYDKPSPIGGGWCGGKFKYQLMSVQGRQTHYCNWQTLVTQKKMGTQALQSLWKRGYATPVLVCRFLICTFYEYCEYRWQNWRTLTISRGQGSAGPSGHTRTLNDIIAPPATPDIRTNKYLQRRAFIGSKFT